MEPLQHAIEVARRRRWLVRRPTPR
jgi:hypothetical protein